MQARRRADVKPIRFSQDSLALQQGAGMVGSVGAPEHRAAPAQEDMPLIRLTMACPAVHRTALLRLNVEYLSWVFDEIERWFGVLPAELCNRSAPDYVLETLNNFDKGKFTRGRLYLIEIDGELAGMYGLRHLDNGAEIKRLYVRPKFRRRGLARCAMERLQQDAYGLGYSCIYLDTGPFMHSAHQLYAKMGFVDCSPRIDAEVPVVLHGMWRFMQKRIS